MKRFVLVTGATGTQGRAVLNALQKRGHSVRAFVRKPVDIEGAEIAVGSFEDPASLVNAMEGVDAVFAVTTPMVSGVDAEVAQGKAIVDAAKAAKVAHVVFSSVGDADRKTGIPHFDSKAVVEEYLVASGVPHTITAPAYFYDNILFPWNLAALKQGTFAQALPSTRKLKMVSAADIGRFNAIVLERRDEFLGKRIDYAGDELTGVEIAAVLATSTGGDVAYHEQPIEDTPNDDMRLMYEWFDSDGYSADIPSLRSSYPEVEWSTFSDWASKQDWPALLA